MSPKISIIVPIYNAENYLHKCLESIRNQTFKDFEVICVDDGSTDSSSNIMDEFAKIDSRFIVIHKKNEGNGKSMNRGLAVAKGEYIGIVEADDYIDTRMYEELYALTDCGTVDVVKGSFWNCYETSIGERRIPNRERDSVDLINKVFTVRECPQILWGHPSIWSGIYKKSLIEQNNIVFREAKGGGWVDNPFFFETLCCAKSIIWTRTPYYCYRTAGEGSSSSEYDYTIPFERMIDNLEVLKKRGYNDEETLKVAYARGLMYLCGALDESNFEQKEDSANVLAAKMLANMDSDVIMNDFHIYDQKNYLKYSSPIRTAIPKKKKILIYNWIPFDNPQSWGGGVTVYCKNLISEFVKNRPDVQVFFLSSGWAYDITKSQCFIRKINNIFGERCKSYEVVNSPVPAPQDMLFTNPEVAFENEILRTTIDQFINKYGPFEAIHFNNLEGLSLDVLALKKKYQQTKFLFSLHNYTPFCMTGFYFDRHNHCNCSPIKNSDRCDACINRDNSRKYCDEVVARGKFGVQDAYLCDEYGWIDSLGFDRLDQRKDASCYDEFTERAIDILNKNMDEILAVSERVRKLAVENGLDSNKVVTSYIGTRVANYQIGESISKVGEYFKLGYLGSDLGYEEKGYPFLIEALSKIDINEAQKIDLMLTTTTLDRDDYILSKLKAFHSVDIIHGYKHSELSNILKNVNLGVVPVLWEDNLPQIAIEMVAHGVPILTSDAGGANEIARNDNFVFKAGDSKSFTSKLLRLVNHPERLNDYWKSSMKLVSNKEHYQEMVKRYGLCDENSEIRLSLSDWAKIVEENSFLYKYFKGGESNASVKINEQLKSDNDVLRERVNELQWRLDETRKSKSYKLAMAITFIPRKIMSRKSADR